MTDVYQLQAHWPLRYGDNRQLRKARIGLHKALRDLKADGYTQIGPICTEIREPHLVKTVKLTGPASAQDPRLTVAWWGAFHPDRNPEDDNG